MNAGLHVITRVKFKLLLVSKSSVTFPWFFQSPFEFSFLDVTYSSPFPSFVPGSRAAEHMRAELPSSAAACPSSSPQPSGVPLLWPGARAAGPSLAHLALRGFGRS